MLSPQRARFCCVVFMRKRRPHDISGSPGCSWDACMHFRAHEYKKKQSEMQGVFANVQVHVVSVKVPGQRTCASWTRTHITICVSASLTTYCSRAFSFRTPMRFEPTTTARHTRTSRRHGGRCRSSARRWPAATTHTCKLSALNFPAGILHTRKRSTAPGRLARAVVVQPAAWF